MPSPFVHLHVHSHYSLLQALPKVDALAARAKELGMDALALTDYGSMYGAIEFIQECRKAGIKPIVGQCAYLAVEKLTDRRPRIDDKQHQIVLLSENALGYKNLLKLTTIAHLDGFYYKPRIDKETLRAHANGLIGLSGGMKGDIAKALSMDEFGKAELLVAEYVDIFGPGNFFLELQDHPELDEQQAHNRDLIRLSERTGAPLVATKDVHYFDPKDADAHDVLVCIGEGKTVDDERRTRMTDADYSFATGEQMERAFADRPDAILNTRKIADRCSLDLELGRWNFADIAIPDGETYDSYLRKQVEEGMAKKVPILTETIRQRLDYELGIITKKGYAPYFLVVSDYIRWAKERGIITTTRGSAAGSLACYAIDIVSVNPLDYNLPFERFLNPFRPSPPDVDADFEDARRDEVIAYVTEKYGKDRVAQIGTFGTLAARGAVRDVGRALGLPYALCDRVSKMIPMGSQGFPMTLARALEITPELKQLAGSDPSVRRLLGLAQRVEGSARHVSVHAAGVVIAPKPLTEYTALQREAGGEKLITQYEMNTIEAAGVLKMDFLGIRNLSILGRAVDIIRKTRGVTIDINHLPLDDAKTYKMLADGDTTGLFQLNGDGMTRYLKELKPTTIHDIMAMVALYRPGPLESIPEYIRRKHDPSLVTYLDPRLEKILDRSFGIITYQDDVLLTAIHLAGYTWEEADKFRKAMGKKIPEEMAKQKDKFLNGCVANGMTKDKADQLWQLIEPFAAYGFCKAHAAAYGMVAYQTAYLKANYPVEYMTAVLSAESGDAEKVADVVAECGHAGISVLPPDVNSSDVDFAVIDDSAIRFGLLGIKNLGADLAAGIIAERSSAGTFASMADFSARVGSKNFNKKQIETLIKSGALDSLGERNRLLVGIEQILTYHRVVQKDAESGQANIFVFDGTAPRPELVLREAPSATKREKLAWERELLGLYVSAHPFADHAAFFGQLLTTVAELPARRGAVGLVPVGGIVMESKQILTKKKNEAMAFVTLEDMTGSVEVVVFPSIYRDCRAFLHKDAAVLVEGKLDERDGELKLLAEKITVITTENGDDLKHLLSASAGGARSGSGDSARTALADERSELCVAVPAKMPASMADELKRVFAEHPGGRRVCLLVKEGPAEKKIATSFSVAFSGDLVAGVERLVGRGAVRGE